MSRSELHVQHNRARTAIVRTSLSRPLKRAIADGLITSTTRVFDYGCGRGDDLRYLIAMGYKASGWDPVYRSEAVREPSTVVNLGYVVNVIEDINERCEALRRAWALTKDLLIVSARLTLDSRALGGISSFADGYLTSRGTFQKFFEQQELRHWIEETLQVQAVAAAPGVFYVFRNDQARSTFLAASYLRRTGTPRATDSADLFAAHQELLEPMMQFLSARGRAPVDEELENASELVEAFGSVRKAFRVVLGVTEGRPWEQIRHERKEDLLVFLALSKFEGRPRFGRLPQPLQRDIKAFFGSYSNGCAKADDLLFSLGKPGVLNAAFEQSSIGKVTPSALYVHESAISEISPLLRIYEGCARGYLGSIDGANIIKLHVREPKVSYLSYPEFENDPHPPLAFAVTVHLQTFRVNVRDYRISANRPILHRKELFVSEKHPSYTKFSRLTRIEQSKGLYLDTRRIGFEVGWRETLRAKGLYLKGHRLLKIRTRSRRK